MALQKIVNHLRRIYLRVYFHQRATTNQYHMLVGDKDHFNRCGCNSSPKSHTLMGVLVGAPHLYSEWNMLQTHLVKVPWHSKYMHRSTIGFVCPNSIIHRFVLCLIVKYGLNLERRKEDDSNLATCMNYGVVCFKFIYFAYLDGTKMSRITQHQRVVSLLLLPNNNYMCNFVESSLFNKRD